MNKMSQLTGKRTAERLKAAHDITSEIIEAARLQGVELQVVGSLAKNDFRLHSDIDILVRGDSSPETRAFVERLVADKLRSTDIPYDLIYECDITNDRLEELVHGCF